MPSAACRWVGAGPDGPLDDNLFKEVYVSSRQGVRIMKIIGVSERSKHWAADPANRECDAPGSWYCPGQYPPALRALMPTAHNLWTGAEDEEEAEIEEQLSNGKEDGAADVGAATHDGLTAEELSEAAQYKTRYETRL